MSADAAVDVAVVGGGPAGSAVALLLARAGARVALFEASRYEARRIGETLVPAIGTVLAPLGLWPAFAAAGHLPCHGVRSRWGAEAEQLTSFVFNAHGHGWHVDRAAFDRALFDAACAAGARGFAGAGALEIARAAHGWRLIAAGKPVVRAAFVVDATGRRSWVARRLGARRQSGAGLVASAVWLAAERPAALQVQIEAMADGWCYAAPQPGGGRVFVQFGDPAAAQGLRGDWFAPSRGTRLWREGVEGNVQLEQRRCRAESSSLDRLHGPGWLAVGDAALALDPLAGDGVLRCIAMAFAAARALTATLCGDAAALQDHADSVRACAAEHAAGEALFYAREQRWPRQAFWSQRHTPAGAPSRRDSSAAAARSASATVPS